MAVLDFQFSQPPDTPCGLGRGMEQFHHPRPVRVGDRGNLRPTAERDRLLNGLAGTVLEIGAGDGVKLTCYPPTVEDILLVEPDPFLRAAAQHAVNHVAPTVRILDGGPARLPVADASCDAVVCSLVLCRAPRLEATLAEVRRVLRRNGELRFYEHQPSPRPVLALAGRLATPLWSRVSGGCRPARDTVAAIERTGFTIEALDRFSLHHVGHALGLAKPR
ncbi:class I SAM-dependent methyltransferase [Acrocarpospora corrugata]|uniref:class I SAM-dependent methyltransferase n=1 Tax=Acrocarpospora corrugata TaxID=35763 RepID=UPI001FEAAF3B|nr:class I SAM-dependent methyltransferase [Acrocarpospora corrugata]